VATATDEFRVDFPTLWVAPDWIESHCPQPDRIDKGKPLELYNWQLWCTVNHYRVKPTATVGQLATAFYYRRSQVIAPQKTGKGPWSATIIANEAGGPAIFAGWAKGGELYACREWGCYCGWTYEYEPGEPMGRPWPTPLIQLLATSQDQTDNVYRPLQSMIKNGPLRDVWRVGEEFIRLPNDGRIDVVTSSARSRLGNPITFALQDESGVYLPSNGMRDVAETQRRGLAGMGGRSMETTNPPDPSAESVAQRTFESQRPDIFKFWRPPPGGLSFANKVERRRILRHVYAGSTHVDLDAIEAEAAELIEKDPAQAERFFGNRMVAGHSSWLDGDKWALRGLALPATVLLGRRQRVALAFDGSDVDDWSGFRAETMTGYQFTPTYGPDKLPAVWNPADHNGQVPRLEVRAALDEIMSSLQVVRLYFDPPYWETEGDEWIDKYGDKKVIPWYTRRLVQMHAACERLRTDVLKQHSGFTHDGCRVTEAHIRNTRTSLRPSADPKQPKYVLVKASPAQKIDMTISSVLVHEAVGDCIAAGLAADKRSYVFTA
jgi:hypothetical protein